MIKEFTVNNFRGFSEFSVKDLGRVNLLVGTNNSGKTSVLEAIELLGAMGDISVLWNSLARRGERFWIESERRIVSEGDIAHLFNGHELKVGAFFELVASNDQLEHRLRAEIVERLPADDSEQIEAFEEEDDLASVGPLVLRLNWNENKDDVSIDIPLTSRGGFPTDVFRKRLQVNYRDRSRVQFITTAALESAEVVRMLQDVVLTEEEDLVLQALKTIEPSIERIAPVASDVSRPYLGQRQKGGVAVKCSGVRQRIPIGSMGDGIWRMLGLALALVRSEDGVLLVDEIDTGLHFSVMSDMWKLVDITAKRLNVQVFATTHSRDCYESLATIARDRQGQDSVSIQRIDRSKSRSVVFGDEEIVIAAERGIEVR